LRDRSLSKMAPRLRVVSVGVRLVPWKGIEVDVTLARCCGVPMIRYSVFDGLTDSLFAVNQSWTESRVEDSTVREWFESELLNDI
jgi:hypothetical protein